MKTDSEIRTEGMNALAESLGDVAAERFVSLILREPFDYTRWRQGIFGNRTVEELSRMAQSSEAAKSDC